ENASARQTVATIARTDGRGSFWPKLGSRWQRPKRSQRRVLKQAGTTAPLRSDYAVCNNSGSFAIFAVIRSQQTTSPQHGTRLKGSFVAPEVSELTGPA